MSRLRLKLDLTSILILLTFGVLLPVLLSAAVGIVALVVTGTTSGIVIGVLVICFTAAAAGSAVAAAVLTARKARLARLQSDFIANVTHELKTPLSSIRLHAQTLQSGLLADDARQTAACLDTIRRETEWLDTMLDKVLTWRAAAGDMWPMTWRIQPLSAAVRAAIARFRTLIPDGEVDLVFTDRGRNAVRHDPDALEAVVLNLLTNADNKNTGPDKRIEVTIRDEGEMAVITVCDNGPGFPRGAEKRIFQPFYRATDDGGGVGLGLAIARHVVDRHGGTIRAANEEAGGARFTIELPTVRSAS